MSNYYLLLWKHKPELASAFTSGSTLLDHELIPLLDGKDSFPFDFELIKLKEGKDRLIETKDLTGLSETWLDYQPNNLAWPLMSEKLKSIIERSITEDHQIDWLTCRVKSKSEERNYYILRFNKMMDVLDMHRTSFIEGTDVIIKPVFSLYKIKPFNVFSYPLSPDLWKISPRIYVSEALKKVLQKERLTGISFIKVAVT